MCELGPHSTPVVGKLKSLQLTELVMSETQHVILNNKLTKKRYLLFETKVFCVAVVPPIAYLPFVLAEYHCWREQDLP